MSEPHFYAERSGPRHSNQRAAPTGAPKSVIQPRAAKRDGSAFDAVHFIASCRNGFSKAGTVASCTADEEGHFFVLILQKNYQFSLLSSYYPIFPKLSLDIFLQSQAHLFDARHWPLSGIWRHQIQSEGPALFQFHSPIPQDYLD